MLVIDDCCVISASNLTDRGSKGHDTFNIIANKEEKGDG